MRIGVIICSAGRPATLAALMPWLARQSRPADRTVLVVTQHQDLPDPADFAQCPGIEIVIAQRGLPRQRNRGLEHLQGDCDAVLFIDDDYLLSRHALAGIERAFATFPQVVGLTGQLLADGIGTGGISVPIAADLIHQFEGQEVINRTPKALRRNLVGLYGCNMAFRLSAVGDRRFDERLPLYAWQEDVDFAARIPGEKIATDAFTGVHCGTQSGREARGHELGYSQVANAVYLWRKGSLPGWFALRQVMRNLLANHLRRARAEPWIDRRGRAAGNRQALRDVLAGRDDPARILDLKTGAG